MEFRMAHPMASSTAARWVVDVDSQTERQMATAMEHHSDWPTDSPMEPTKATAMVNSREPVTGCQMEQMTAQTKDSRLV